MSDEVRSSITDQPIRSLDEERLGVKDYASSMADFISTCATPLTIGIQGEWGSGKTSLMFMIKECLGKRVATSWVNTWEYSMFRSADLSVPAVLNGMLEGLADELGKAFPANSDKLDKSKRILKNVGKVLFDAAAKQTLGVDNVADRVGEKDEELTKASIADLKAKINGVISDIVAQESTFDKVAFFIDDLDRLEPPVAVAILESLKNIFDLDNCVFVLAIDYDVVVKGLTHKFGEKTAANEREFRSFFDKIIQVPFAMPVGSYDIGLLMKSRMEDLGLAIAPDMEGAYKGIVNTTVGGNPRSIKRYLNTYSLLRRIRNLEAGSSDEVSPTEEFALFAVIGMQIAYPRIYNLLLKEHNFTSWDQEFGRPLDVTISIPKEYKENELLDEEWEQFIWSFCSKDAYLKARAMNVLSSLNNIRDTVGKDQLEDAIGAALSTANITSVDDDVEAKQVKFQRVRLAGWPEFAETQKSKGIPAPAIAVQKAIHSYIGEKWGPDGFLANYAPGQISYYPMVGGKGKVFLYAKPNKRAGAGVRLHFTDSDEFVRATEFTDDIQAHIDRSFAAKSKGQSA